MSLCQKLKLQLREVKETRWDVSSRARRTLAFFTIVFVFPFLFHAGEWIAVLTTDFVRSCPEPDSSETEQCFDWVNKKIYTTSLVDARQPEYNIPNAPLTSNRKFNEPHLFEGSRYNSLIIVTACTPEYYIRLKNLVGSIHYWEPKLKIIIYDIGLRKKQQQEIATWKRVELVKFKFENYPPYVALLWNFSWKIFIIKEVTQTHKTVLWLDSGIELRHPLVGVRHFLEKDGFFGTTMEKRKHITGATTMQETFDLMRGYGLEKMDDYNEDNIKGSPFCSGYAMGFDLERSQSILDYAIKCAKDENCISPKGANPDKHNFDQSAFTISVYSHGLSYACEHENIVADTGEFALPTVDETRCNYIELAARRWRSNRPYSKYIDRVEVQRKMPSEKLIEQLKPEFLNIEPKNYTNPEVVVVERRQRIGNPRESDQRYMDCIDGCKTEIHEYNAHFQICVLTCREETEEPIYEAYQTFVKSLKLYDRTYAIYFTKGRRCSTVKRKTLLFTILSWISAVVFLFTPYTLKSCFFTRCRNEKRYTRKHLHDL